MGNLLEKQERSARSMKAGLCTCYRCLNERDEIRIRMGGGCDCGNKRCPKASDHRLACTNSNEPGQPGSIYTRPTTGEK